jgi:hypothetical protein
MPLKVSLSTAKASGAKAHNGVRSTSGALKHEALRYRFVTCDRHGTIALLIQRSLRIQKVEPKL